MEISERVALVTGGGAGIGRAICRRLAADGASVVVADREAEAGRATVDEIRFAGGRAALSVTDVSTRVMVYVRRLARATRSSAPSTS